MNSEQSFRLPIPKLNRQLLKLVLIGFMVLLLLIPVLWISSLVSERYARKDGVIREIAGKWGAEQTVSGPFISVPYSETIQTTDQYGKAAFSELTRYIHFAPDSLQIGGKISSVLHKRGIFKVSGYQAELDLNAVFAPLPQDNPAYQKLPLRWADAVVTFDLSDQRGMKELSGRLNGQALVFNRADGVLRIAGLTDTPDPNSSFLRMKAECPPEQETDFQLAAKVPADIRSSGLALSIRMGLTGTQQLSFTTSALRETVNLAGDWPSPSFVGDLLPQSHRVDSKGFQASWQTTSLNSGIKQTWSSEEPVLRLSNLGVNFLVMVDSYQQTTRALKYSLLFLLLTFMTFFFAELSSKQKIHPIQYLMVGCALVIFYLLLLSLSEHLAFGWAYLIAAAAVLLQISLYCFSILKTRGFALKIGALLAFLYAFLYLLLRLEDSALLVGSLSLFVLLSLAMFLFRNINWYGQE